MNQTPVRRSAEASGDASRARVARMTLVAVGIVVLAIVAWRLASVLLLLFGSVLLAVALAAFARLLVERAHVPRKLGLPVAVVAVVAIVGLAGWLVGDRVADQMAGLRERLPQALDALTKWLGTFPLGTLLLEDLRGLREGGIPWARVLNVATVTLGALGSAIVVIAVGVFLAANPRDYRDGFVRLFPVVHRETLRDALDESGEALRRWLVGQFLSMLFVGIATTIGLALLGMPLALSLGLIAGILDFVPFIGPFVAGAIAVLFAFVEGPQQALYVLLLFVVIQQVEGNVLIPLVQRWAVALPPVLAIMAAVGFGVLFGVGGVLIATPLMVVTMVLVRRLYIEGELEAGHAGDR